MTNMIAGAAGGVGAQVGGGFNAQFGPGAGMAVAGLVLKNPTVQTLAGMSLAQAVVGSISGGANTGGTSSGWY